MKRVSHMWISLLAMATFLCIVPTATWAQAASSPASSPTPGSIEFVARVTPTAGRAEPVRQVTFYLLRKSFANIRKEGEAAAPKPDMEKFIAGLKVSTELKEWMKKKKTVALDSPDIVPMLKADDILKVTEFYDAYLRANAGMRVGLPKPKYRDADKEKNPEKYARQKVQYNLALHKFIELNPLTVEGIETELETVSPQRTWAQLNAEYDKSLRRRLSELAQVDYLVAKADSDLEGRASLSGVPAGAYWLSTLGQLAVAGDARLTWDVKVIVNSGQVTRVDSGSRARPRRISPSCAQGLSG